jgi:hypothetical protein
VAVVFVGLDQTSEAENFDRNDMLLPGVQEDLVKEVLAVQPRTVVVFINGGSISSQWIADNVPAILEAFYGGELGGAAIVGALNGSFSPAGKMPVTVYFNNFTARDIRDVDLSADGGITHKYFDGNVIYPFGWGLSYTSFSYTILSPSVSLQTSEIAAKPPTELLAQFEVEVENTGHVTSDCVLLGFLKPLNRSSPRQPRQILFNFDRISALPPGQRRRATLSLPLNAITEVSLDGTVHVSAQTYTVSIGDVQMPAVSSLEIKGDKAIVEQMAWTKALVAAQRGQ